MKNTKKVCLITGASKGIGKAIAERLSKENYTIIGTSRNPDKIPGKERLLNVEYLSLDLTDEKSIKAFIKKLNVIDILINNAGISQIGPVEEAPMDRVEYLFNLNLLGIIRLTQGMLPSMRERGKGCIINISSMAGRIAVPFSALYAASKAGIEGFSAGLRNEVAEYGIKVVIVSPGYINTSIPQERYYSDASPYRESIEKVKQVRDNSILHSPGPDIIAKKISKILKMKNPGPYYPAGGAAPVFAFLAKHLPASFVQKQVRKKFLQN